ncbi:MAG TPA: hypothetical protein VIV61_03075 [Candidatus Ozemobacteraceae bacterium]
MKTILSPDKHLLFSLLTLFALLSFPGVSAAHEAQPDTYVAKRDVQQLLPELASREASALSADVRLSSDFRKSAALTDEGRKALERIARHLGDLAHSGRPVTAEILSFLPRTEDGEGPHLALYSLAEAIKRHSDEEFDAGHAHEAVYALSGLHALGNELTRTGSMTEAYLGFRILSDCCLKPLLEAARRLPWSALRADVDSLLTIAAVGFDKTKIVTTAQEEFERVLERFASDPSEIGAHFRIRINPGNGRFQFELKQSTGDISEEEKSLWKQFAASKECVEMAQATRARFRSFLLLSRLSPPFPAVLLTRRAEPSTGLNPFLTSCLPTFKNLFTWETQLRDLEDSIRQLKPASEIR